MVTLLSDYAARHPARLRENLAALDLTPPDDELAQLEPIAAQVTGDRYPDVTGTSTAREARASLQPCHLSA